MLFAELNDLGSVLKHYFDDKKSDALSWFLQCWSSLQTKQNVLLSAAQSQGLEIKM